MRWLGRIGFPWGPAVILVLVLVLLRDFITGNIGAQHPDLLALWLPNHCFLGRSLAQGVLPAWNPHILGGVPFLADPQSGWLNLEAMLLYAAMPCGRALRFYVVLQPAVAGLGIYALLRATAASKVGATLGGVAGAAAIGGSRLAVSLAFSASLAWTAVLLWALAKTLTSSKRRPFVLWSIFAAVAWGQVAASHPAHGLFVATVGAAGVMASWWASASGGAARWDRCARVAFVCLVMVSVNVAILLPRLAYLSQTNLGEGYRAFGPESAAGAIGRIGAASGLDTFVALVTPPGVFFGVLCLLLSLTGLRRLRDPIARGLVIAAGALLLFSTGIAASTLSRVASSYRWFDFYLHEPERLATIAVLVVPILIGIGFDAVRGSDRTSTIARRLRWLPIGRRISRHSSSLLAALVFLELGVGAAIARPVAGSQGVIAGDRFGPLYRQTEGPLIDSYLAVDPLATELAAMAPSRYASLDRGRQGYRGYLDYQSPRDWRFLTNQRAMLFGLEDLQGSTAPVQPLRTWTLTRALGTRPVKYNASFFPRITKRMAYLMDLDFLITPESESHRLSGRDPLVSSGGFSLRRLSSSPGRVELYSTWDCVPSPVSAMKAVVGKQFDFTREVIVECGVFARTPSNYGSLPTPSSVQVDRWGQVTTAVRLPAAGLLVVRNPYDSNWKAWIDDREVSIVPANYNSQGIFIPSGEHVVKLRYEDPSIRRSAALSLSSLIMFFMLAFVPFPPRRSIRSLPGSTS